MPPVSAHWIKVLRLIPSARTAAADLTYCRPLMRWSYHLEFWDDGALSAKTVQSEMLHFRRKVAILKCLARTVQPPPGRFGRNGGGCGSESARLKFGSFQFSTDFESLQGLHNRPGGALAMRAQVRHGAATARTVRQRANGAGHYSPDLL